MTSSAAEFGINVHLISWQELRILLYGALFAPYTSVTVAWARIKVLYWFPGVLSEQTILVK